MKLDATDRKRLTDVISEVPQTMSVGVTVTFRDRRPIDDGWEIAELQDEVSAACAGTDVHGYIVTLTNKHEWQSFVIVLSRRPR